MRTYMCQFHILHAKQSHCEMIHRGESFCQFVCRYGPAKKHLRLLLMNKQSLPAGLRLWFISGNLLKAYVNILQINLLLMSCPWEEIICFRDLVQFYLRSDAQLTRTLKVSLHQKIENIFYLFKDFPHIRVSLKSASPGQL